MPGTVMALAFALVGSSYATVDPEKCQACGLCVKNCPVGGLIETEGGIRSVRKNCIACYCCSEVCPHDAIVMRRAFGADFLKAVSRLVRKRPQ